MSESVPLDLVPSCTLGDGTTLGYTYKEANQDWKCAICLYPYIEPCTLHCCGQMVCHACIKAQVNNPSFNSKCALCTGVLHLSNKKDLFANNGKITKAPNMINNLLAELIVICNVCKLEIRREQFVTHQEQECQVSCEQCQMILKRKELPYHQKHLCLERQVACCPFAQLNQLYLSQQGQEEIQKATINNDDGVIDPNPLAKKNVLCQWIGIAKELRDHRLHCSIYQQIVPVYSLLSIAEPRVKQFMDLEEWHTERYCKIRFQNRKKFEKNLWKFNYLLIDVEDLHARPEHRWRQAEVIEHDRIGRGKVKVHYIGWNRQYDEWISIQSKRLQPLYTFTSIIPTTLTFKKQKSIVNAKSNDALVLPLLNTNANANTNTSGPDTSQDEEFARRLEAEELAANQNDTYLPILPPRRIATNMDHHSDLESEEEEMKQEEMATGLEPF